MNKSITLSALKSALIVCLVLLMSFSSFSSWAQSASKKDDTGKMSITGDVRDKATSGQLVGATMRIYNSSDSLVGQGKAEGYAWSSAEKALVKSSHFDIKIPHVKDIYTIEVGYENYDTLYQTVNLRDLGRREFSRNIGTLSMQRPRVEHLKEVTVTASKVKFYNRGDTIVYNADAFQLADGSMLDALVKQLPGVELKEGGQIYVNGEYVEELLLNGRDFFKGDNQIMLDNLGAYAVQNIEVYKKIDEINAFIGNNSEHDKKLVMDVKIKKEYVGGWNFNFEAGAGTQERYLGRLFGMHFTGTSQFSLYANVNNLNDSRSPTSDNQWNPANRPEGTKDFREAGFCYSMEQSQSKTKEEGSLILRLTNSRYNDGVNTINFLPMGNNYQYSTSSRRQHDFMLQTTHRVRKETSRTIMSLSPWFQYRFGKSWSVSHSATMNASSERDTALVYGRRLIGGTLSSDIRQKMINASFNDAYNGDYNLNAQVTGDLTIKIPRSSDALGITASYQYQNNHFNNENDYCIAYGDQSISPTARAQRQKVSPNQTNNISGRVYYRMSFSDNTSLEASYAVNYQRQRRNSAFYLGQLEAETTGDYTLGSLAESAMNFDPSNSYTSHENNLTNSFGLSLNMDKGRFSYFLKPSIEFYNNSLDYNQVGQTSTPRFNKVMTDVMAIIQYTSEDHRSLIGQLSMIIRPNTPSLMDMITPVNTSDPLNVYLGNPNLKSGYRYAPTLFISKSRSGVYTFYIQGGLSFSPNSITKGYVYDNTTGIRYHKSYNVNGNMSASTGGGWSWKYRKFNLNYGVNYTNSRNYTMIGENGQAPEKSRMNNQRVDNEFRLAYEPTSKFKIEFNYSPAWQWAHNQRGTSYDIREDKIGLQFNAKLPYNWGLRTSMDMFGRNGYGDKEMDTTDWIWNARITKSFIKGQLLLALDAYDLLHQMRAVSYSISPQCRIEKFTNTIPRYILFHVQYKLNIMPKKDSVKKAEKVWSY